MEGETEKWYFEHLQKLINNKEELPCTVKLYIKINKSIKYISEIFCSITFALGTVMYSPSITLAWFFSWGIPMLILTSFTGEK